MHDRERSQAKRSEPRVGKGLKKNGKYFVPPPGDGSSLKELFDMLTAAGAGRLVAEDGFPSGPWSPDLLADAISEIDANQSGIDLRTVQLWFQDNDRGVSPNNIRWLARIFGCGDSDATSMWQVELSAANRRLAAKRKKKKAKGRSVDHSVDQFEQSDVGGARAGARVTILEKSIQRFNLAANTERFFDSSRAPMVLPLVVFTGACALALIAFSLNLHSVLFASDGNVPKQIGYLWAPNWTVNFLAVLPLYLALFIDLLRCWKEEWRPRLLAIGGQTNPNIEWEERVAAASYALWATFMVTVVVASGINWIATHLIPLLSGDTGGWAVHWGRVAIVRPDLVSLPGAIGFTALAFMFNGFTTYFFFASQVLLQLIKHDYLDLLKGFKSNPGAKISAEFADVGFSIMIGIFRCASLGVMITILMKLQSSFLQSDSENLVEWLIADFRSLFGDHDVAAWESTSLGIAPGFYYSFFCLLAVAGNFANASVRIRWALMRFEGFRHSDQFFTPWMMMNGAIVMLVTSYFAVGILPGFTILLIVSLVLATYLICRPASAWNRKSQNWR